MVQGADTIITGAFVNLRAVCDFLVAQSKPVLLGCAAWKDRFNLEDTLFAGAVVSLIGEHFSVGCDSARAARTLAQQCNGAYLEYLKDSSHYHRLAGYGLEEDLKHCTTPDLHPVVPILRGNELVAY
jgi:2-phosphosulfolactate phosphatase